MALLNTTTLSAAVGASDLLIPVVSTTAMVLNQPLQIDGELMVIAGPITTQSVKVRMRGNDGTAAVAHNLGATVSTGPASDFPIMPVLGASQRHPEVVDDVVTLGADLTVTVPSKNTTYLITKSSIAAITLSTASVAQVGVQLTFIAQTAFAHTITYAPGFRGTTLATDVATFSGDVGATLRVVVTATGLIVPVDLSSVTLG